MQNLTFLLLLPSCYLAENTGHSGPGMAEPHFLNTNTEIQTA